MTAAVLQQETIITAEVVTLPWSDVATGEARGRVLTSQELLMEGSLDWDVDIRPLYRRMKDTRIIEHPRAKEVYRTDTEVSLGVVRGHYHPCSNREAFAPWDMLVAAGEGLWQECGFQRNGSRVFMTMKLAEGITVLDGDRYEYYLFIGIGHDGYVAMNPSVIPVRVAGLAHSAVGVNSIRFQHTPSQDNTPSDEEVQQTHQLAEQYRHSFTEWMTNLAEINLSDDAAARLLDKVLNPKRARRSEVVTDIMRVYQTSPYQGAYQGTGYGLFNALTEWQCQHRKHRQGNARFDSLMWGDDAQTRQRLAVSIKTM